MLLNYGNRKERFPRLGTAPCLLLAFLLSTATALGGQLPELYRPDLPWIGTDMPVWVEAGEAFTEEGEIRSSVFHPVLESKLRTYLAGEYDPTRDCIVATENFLSTVDAADFSSLESAVRDSQLILVGRVGEKTPGYYAGVPGQMVEVSLERTLKGEAALSTYFFFLPVGTIPAGKQKFCKTDYRVPGVPDRSDSIVLMIPRLGPDSEPFLYLDPDSQASMTLLGADGTAKLPFAFRQRDSHDGESSARAVENEAFLSQIEAAIEADEEKEP